MSAILITGNTYPVKDAIKAMGGRWDAAAKGWRVPADKAAQAQGLVASAPRQTNRAYRPRTCQCGAKLTGGYGKCRDCYYHDQECDALGLDRNWDA